MKIRDARTLDLKTQEEARRARIKMPQKGRPELSVADERKVSQSRVKGCGNASGKEIGKPFGLRR